MVTLKCLSRFDKPSKSQKKLGGLQLYTQLRCDKKPTAFIAPVSVMLATGLNMMLFFLNLDLPFYFPRYAPD